MKTYPAIDCTDAVASNHALWLPDRGVKIPWQRGGRIQKRTRPEEARYPLDSIVDEVCILRALAARSMAPPIGDLVYFEEVIHESGWVDPCGAIGYEMADASKLSPGAFDVSAMRLMPIEGSPGAWEDAQKDENVVNGYLVDVRRTAWDCLAWKGPRFCLPDPRPLASQLVPEVHARCQFPAGERELAYQDFWCRGEFHRGQRRVQERADLLGFRPRPGETVLDVGCQAGGMLQYAYACAAGNGTFIGVDVDPEYLRIAKALARSSGQDICYKHIDVTKGLGHLASLLLGIAPGGVDHLLLLSLEKHIGEDVLFAIVDAVEARHAYIETNAVRAATELKLYGSVRGRGGVHTGISTDRNLRQLYRIDK